ncbi:kinase-like protein [Dichomitus squalens]|uniref:non-specific serine/threonine protein kinase n=1 Tax=Dichomitus squalens TaxID=114155 RepID=A0A4Q9NK24_9APHY|nr:kinase-like protein [Dichomitus squalens]TBU64322.1 kinase-like protein [Dichomitus squalens]
MLKLQVTSPSPDTTLPATPTLAELSRNASVISSSSSNSSAPDLTLTTPVRPRPIRNFSAPRTNLRERSPHSPTSPLGPRPPPYLTKELGYPEDDGMPLRPPASRGQSKSRNSSVTGRMTVDDFEFMEELGQGSYSTVWHCRLLATGQEYAIKRIDKAHLKRHQKEQTALAEKNTLVRLGSGHPGIVRLHWTFQDEWSLFFVLDLARNGELQTRISRMGSLSIECVRYYAAQIVDALGYMHSKGVIHRDLKPENLLLDDAFRIKITDFGTGKLLDSGGEPTKTFVGTAQYVSPELLEHNESSKSSDFWALGCIIYQMIAGRFVFRGLADWQKIKQLEYDFPEGFDEQAQDLVRKLLVRDPDQRLGAGPSGSPYDMKALRSHPFFASINWRNLWSGPAPPLEAGLIKKDAPQPSNISLRLAWDELDENAIEDEDDQDELDDAVSWTSNGGGTEHQYSPTRTNGHAPAELIGPYGERKTDGFPPLPLSNVEEERSSMSDGVRFVSPSQASSIPEDEVRDTVHDVLDVPVPTRSLPIDVPCVRGPGSHSTGSISSSSDGSPVDKLAAALDEAARGRPRAQTPIQGNGLHDPVVYVASLAFAFFRVFYVPLPFPWSCETLTGIAERRNSLMLPDEHVIFNTLVEVGGPKRRASRLLAMAVAPKKHQQQPPRQLVLTTHRLLCVKSKPGRAVQIRTELFVKPPAAGNKDKDKDLRSLVLSIEAKGEREFVVITVRRSISPPDVSGVMRC